MLGSEKLRTGIGNISFKKLPCKSWQEWASVEPNIHRAFGSYIRKRCGANDGARLVQLPVQLIRRAVVSIHPMSRSGHAKMASLKQLVKEMKPLKAISNLGF